MGKLDELMRASRGIAAESMGAVRPPSAPAMHGASAPNSATAPDRLQGITRSRNAAEIPLAKIGPDPDQPREEFDPEALGRLAESMKVKGQLQPIRVRWDEGRGLYVIVCGERRWRAAELAGLATMTAIIHDGPMTPGELLALQLVENCLREDLRPVEQARAFRALMDRNGWSTRQVAEELAVTQSAVVRALALLDLPESVQARVDDGSLPPATAYEVSKIEDPAARAALAERVVADGLTRQETAAAVKASRPAAKGKGRGAGRGKVRKVTSLVIRAGGGKIIVENRRGLDDALTLAMLKEATAQVEARLQPGAQEAA